MKIEEATEILRDMESSTGYMNITKEPLQIALLALEKQSPKYIIPNKKVPELCKCPVCKTELCRDDKNLHYCPTCGQALQV